MLLFNKHNIKMVADPNDDIFNQIGVQKVLSIISFIFTLFGFFLIYTMKKNSMIEYLMMIMCLSESIIFYSIFIIFNSIIGIIKLFHVRQIFTYISLQLLPKEEDDYYPSIFTLYKINNSVYSSFLSLSLIANIFYNLEVITMIRNPLADSSGRKLYYDIILVIGLLASFIANILKTPTVKINDSDPSLMIYDLWRSQ